MSTKSAECLDQVGYVVGELNALDQHVVDVHHHVSTDLVLEDLVDKLLIGCLCILQIEGYYLITVHPMVCYEGRILLILRHHPCLVVAKKASMKLSRVYPEVASISWSILDNGLLSFRHVLLRSIWSTQMYHFLLTFLTIMMLASQSS